ncbi:MAG: membrane bound O-acyl transferase family-domain-containing protein [Planctomycetia bacterium]|nr:membrane bound O-acyl transferase family-domain-containing protein [Planctomycetia bacterium]
MIGTILMLHFGVFRLLANYWRAQGADARPIMNAPWAASSVSEFWGKRWNTGFRDLAVQCIFRPVARRMGVASATWAVFLFSGVVHDLVISLPAGAGYGRPTLYFLIQAMAVQFEHTALAHRLGMHNAIRGRLLAAVVILAPVELLFHAPFRTHVMIPFMEALGAR